MHTAEWGLGRPPGRGGGAAWKPWSLTGRLMPSMPCAPCVYTKAPTSEPLP